MDILIISNFCNDFSSNDNGRFLYIANMLAKEHEIELVTSTFYHLKKCQRVKPANQWPFKITFLYESGYRKNVCLKRFASHYQWGKRVKKYLEKRKHPDVVYCAVPSLTAPMEAAKYCRKHGIKFVIDIQDLWPEAFRMVFHVPVASNLLYLPFTVLADRIYSSADKIVAVSKTYGERAKRVNRKNAGLHIVYLGTDREKFDRCAERTVADVSLQKNDAGSLRIAYAGTLGHSYDLTVVLDAMRELSSDILAKIQLIVMGDGPRRDTFEGKARGLPVLFMGRLDYADMAWVLARCDIAVNPIARGSAASIINKHMDYGMAGLPVINTQESKEYRDLIGRYKCGINCRCNSVADVKEAIEKLVNNEVYRHLLGENHRKLAEEKFDRQRSYTEIENALEIIG